MTRVLLSVADAKTAAEIESVLAEVENLHLLRIGPADDPTADLQRGDWLIVDASRAGTNGFELCRRARQRGAARIVLVLREDESHGEAIARACMATAVLRPPGDRDQVRACLAIGKHRPPVDELLEVAEERIRDHRQQFAEKLIQGISEPAFGDLHMFLADPETGLYNRSYMGLKFDEEFKRARRFGTPLSLVLVECGAADNVGVTTVAQRIAGMILNECRDIDAPGRIEPLLFMILLPGTGAEGCRTLADRLASSLAALAKDLGLAAPPAVGHATCPASGLQHRDDLLHSARRDLAAAKVSAGQRTPGR